jgi:hydroxymethylbilane synthase
VIPVNENCIIGTSSNRRKCQVDHFNRSLIIKDLRGNVPTRIRKLREGQYDAILLAAAGVKRLELDLSDLEVVLLDPVEFLPAPAQGILGIQIRDEEETKSIISQMNDSVDAQSAALERGLLARFDSGCSLPLGVYSEVNDNDQFRLKACLGKLQDERWIDLKSVEMDGSDIENLVSKVYDELNKE